MLSGLLGEVLDLLLAVLFFIVSRSPVHIFLSIPEHTVDQSRQFGSHGGDGLGWPQPGAKAPELRAQVAVAFPQCGRRQAQSRG